MAIFGLDNPTATTGGVTLDTVLVSTGNVNKLLVQADQANSASEYILLYATDPVSVKLMAKLSPGGTFIVGDEYDSDVIDPSKITVKSTSGAGKYTGFGYQR